MMIKSEKEADDTRVLDEDNSDDVSLNVRTKKRVSEVSDGSLEIIESCNDTKSMSLVDVKKEDQASYSKLLKGMLSLPSGCFPDKEKDATSGQNENHISSINHGVLTDGPANDLQVQQLEEFPNDPVIDDLDHIMPKEQQRMLLSRIMLEKENLVPEGASQDTFGKEKEESLSVCGKCTLTGLSSHCVYPSNGSEISNDFMGADENLSQKSLMATQSSFAEGNFEASNTSNFQSLSKNQVKEVSFSHMATVKSEFETDDLLSIDELDHMPLKDRLKLLLSGDVCDDPINTQKSEESSLPIDPELSKPVPLKRMHKRKRTATVSIATALEEDAPGLLRELFEKGVSVDEIQLYGEPEDDDPSDDSCNDNSFKELEEVILKLYTQRQSSSTKLGSFLRCTKTAKISYCLACLMSLVEQARHLQKRMWPVQWGWCRDLKSFIFVFERHNRIVLERPEYGYATYFFELTNNKSLPIDWQIKRLIIAMKLVNCSRTHILEDKALMVGEDLSEEEGKILEQYGWIPNTGLGTMLRYRERVIHDRNKEKKESSEWRAKIVKLLMQGMDNGSFVLYNIPPKVFEYQGIPAPDRANLTPFGN